MHLQRRTSGICAGRALVGQERPGAWRRAPPAALRQHGRPSWLALIDGTCLALTLEICYNVPRRVSTSLLACPSS